MLQRADSAELRWEDLITTLGESEYEEAADIPGARFFRVVTLEADAGETADLQLVASAVDSVADQLRLATGALMDPTADEPFT